MDSVVVHLRDVTEKQVTEFLECAYSFQHGPPWIDAVSGDAALFINLYPNARAEFEPEQWAKVVAALGFEPTVSVIADVSGRHKLERRERVFVRKMLTAFRGVAQDGFTDYCWTLEDFLSGKRIEGHPFFDFSGWYMQTRREDRAQNEESGHVGPGPDRD